MNCFLHPSSCSAEQTHGLCLISALLYEDELLTHLKHFLFYVSNQCLFFFLSLRLNLIRSKSHTYEWFISLSQSHSNWLSITDAPPPQRMTLPQRMSLSQCQDNRHGKRGGAFPKPEQPGAQEGSIHSVTPRMGTV